MVVRSCHAGLVCSCWGATIWVCVCVHACVCACACVCIYIYMCVCASMHGCVVVCTPACWYVLPLISCFLTVWRTTAPQHRRSWVSHSQWWTGSPRWDPASSRRTFPVHTNTHDRIHTYKQHRIEHTHTLDQTHPHTHTSTNEHVHRHQHTCAFSNA